MSAKAGVKPQIGENAPCSHSREIDGKVEQFRCKYVSHYVVIPEGIHINDRAYFGNVVVPQCLADYFNMVEQRYIQGERNIFHNSGREVDMGTFSGGEGNV